MIKRFIRFISRPFRRKNVVVFDVETSDLGGQQYLFVSGNRLLDEIMKQGILEGRMTELIGAPGKPNVLARLGYRVVPEAEKLMEHRIEPVKMDQSTLTQIKVYNDLAEYAKRQLEFKHQ